MASSCGGGRCSGSDKLACNEHDDTVLRLAVVRENGADVVLFDAAGTPRSFSYTGDPGKLCFSTHGHGQVDDLLTPCFDEDGKHGLPEDGCFCGVDTPHLHAHLHDPKTCKDEVYTKKNAQGESDLVYLAQLTLHPTDNCADHEVYSPEETGHLMNWAVSERLPKQCNSRELSTHMRERGDLTQSSLRLRRLHTIQHDDHVDYLVHDATTGDLHLEHPCDSCGDNDVHGKFHCVGKRSLQESGNMQLHFFEVAPNPFSVLEHITGLFDPTSSRVRAARPAVWDNDQEHSKHVPSPPATPKKKSCCLADTCSTATSMVDDTSFATQIVGKTVRSRFVCTKICSSSEIPMIHAILEPMSGVEQVMINVPAKMVTVDHDPAAVSATDIEAMLNRNHFGAQTKCDGVDVASQPKAAAMVGRSQFFVQKICCASEIPAINSIVEPMKGVEKVSINVTTKMVYVDHDTSLVSALDIDEALNAAHFGAHIRHDGADDLRVPLSSFVKSTLSIASSDTPDTQTLKDFLGTFHASQIETFVVDVPSKTINIVHNPHILSADMIIQKLADYIGIETTVVVDGAKSVNWKFPEAGEVEDEIMENNASRPSMPTILSGLFWIISMLSLIGGNLEYLKYVALLSIAFGLPSIGIKAVRALRRFRLDTNVLMFTAVVGALALQDFTEAAAVTFLFSISEWLELRATTRARTALSEIVKLRPDKANFIHPVTKEVMVIPASSVPVGALVSVRTGDKIPCDGVVVEGTSTVDESSLTGESRPVRKGPKDAVSGGTINSGQAQLVVRTTSTSENSAVARLIRLVEEAQANRSPTEKLVDEFATRYTPLVILTAILMCSIPWALGREMGRQWTYNGLVLIVVACPCALIISTPVAYVAGLAATAQRGVLIKGGSHLEALGLVKKIAFDKTGTLTQGSFALLHLNDFGDNYSREEVLQRLALMEERASHPLAQAIIQAVQNENISIPKDLTVRHHTQIAGEGVTGEINGIAVYVGNERLFRRLGLFVGLPPEQKKLAEEWESLGGTVGFMGIEGSGIVCSYCVADSVRPESADVIKRLNKLGIDVIMLTGDNHDAALVIGNQVGLNESEIRSQLLPEDKLTLVADLKEENGSRRGRLFSNRCNRRNLVLMCGDGVNDAPALAAADVGVAMGAGAALAMETSDVTLLDSRLEKLVYSIRMGRRVLRKIFENVIFSIVVKAIVVIFALTGAAHLWAAIAADVGAMLIVTLNGMLLLPSRKKDHQIVDVDDTNEDVEQIADQSRASERVVGATMEALTKSCCSSGHCKSAGSAVSATLPS